MLKNRKTPNRIGPKHAISLHRVTPFTRNEYKLCYMVGGRNIISIPPNTTPCSKMVNFTYILATNNQGSPAMVAHHLPIDIVFYRGGRSEIYNILREQRSDTALSC